MKDGGDRKPGLWIGGGAHFDVGSAAKALDEVLPTTDPTDATDPIIHEEKPADSPHAHNEPCPVAEWRLPDFLPESVVTSSMYAMGELARQTEDNFKTVVEWLDTLAHNVGNFREHYNDILRGLQNRLSILREDYVETIAHTELNTAKLNELTMQAQELNKTIQDFDEAILSVSKGDCQPQDTIIMPVYNPGSKISAPSAAVEHDTDKIKQLETLVGRRAEYSGMYQKITDEITRHETIRDEYQDYLTELLGIVEKIRIYYDDVLAAIITLAHDQQGNVSLDLNIIHTIASTCHVKHPDIKQLRRSSTLPSPDTPETTSPSSDIVTLSPPVKFPMHVDHTGDKSTKSPLDVDEVLKTLRDTIRIMHKRAQTETKLSTHSAKLNIDALLDNVVKAISTVDNFSTITTIRISDLSAEAKQSIGYVIPIVHAATGKVETELRTVTRLEGEIATRERLREECRRRLLKTECARRAVEWSLAKIRNDQKTNKDFVAVHQSDNAFAANKATAQVHQALSAEQINDALMFEIDAAYGYGASGSQTPEQITMVGSRIPKAKKRAAELEVCADELQQSLNKLLKKLNKIFNKIDLATTEIAEMKDQVGECYQRATEILNDTALPLHDLYRIWDGNERVLQEVCNVTPPTLTLPPRNTISVTIEPTNKSTGTL